MTRRKVGFSSHEVAAWLGVKYATLDYWVRKGLLKTMVPADGYGSSRTWGLHDVIAAKVVADLRDQGVPLQQIDKALRVLRRWKADLGHAVLVSLDGHNVFQVLSQDHLVELVQRGGQMSLYPLHEWVAALEPELEKASTASAERRKTATK